MVPRTKLGRDRRAAGLLAGSALAIDPEDPRRLIASGEGGLFASSDEGRRWRPVGGDIGGQPAALLGQAPDGLYVALPDGTIKLSRDGARSWSVRSRP